MADIGWHRKEEGGGRLRSCVRARRKSTRPVGRPKSTPAATAARLLLLLLLLLLLMRPPALEELPAGGLAGSAMLSSDET